MRYADDFLGFVSQGYGGQFRVAMKNLDKFKSRVREITGRNRGVSFAQRCVELRRYEAYTGPLAKSCPGGIYPRLSSNHFQTARSPICYASYGFDARTYIALV